MSTGRQKVLQLHIPTVTTTSETLSSATLSASSFTYANCIAISSSTLHSESSALRKPTVFRAVSKISAVEMDAKNGMASASKVLPCKYFREEKESLGKRVAYRRTFSTHRRTIAGSNIRY
jgi:hypothetical protein